MISACLFSKIDYCNALYFGINASLIKKLQSVQNSAVHLIRKRENQPGVATAEYLKRFHWLPVKKRISFKMLLIVHKCIIGRAPSALSNMVNCRASTRTNKLEEVGGNGVFGDRSFSIAGPKLWNLLPGDIRAEKDTDMFKKKLKTFLFRELDNVCSKF